MSAERLDLPMQDDAGGRAPYDVLLLGRLGVDKFWTARQGEQRIGQEYLRPPATGAFCRSFWPPLTAPWPPGIFLSQRANWRNYRGP